MRLHVKTIGQGSRVVLVHGGMGYPSWKRQEELSENFQLEIVIRPGYPPNPPEATLDFENDANLVANQLGKGAHLVGHSYGAVICLLAASLRPEAIFSLTVSEPPCFSVARGHKEVENFVAALEQLHTSNIQDPRLFIQAFMEIVAEGKAQFPDPLPPELQQLIEALMVERSPVEAQIPLVKLRDTYFPKLIVSGAESPPAHITVCKVLERELGAQHVVLPNTDHMIMHSPDFNRVLHEFLSDAEAK